VVFRLGERSYGIDLGSVREILRPRPATRLPCAPASVIGLVNVRGRIVEHGPKLVGAAVDEVLEVQRWENDGLDAAPGEVQSGSAVRALGTQDGGVVVVLDIHDLLSHVLA